MSVQRVRDYRNKEQDFAFPLKPLYDAQNRQLGIPEKTSLMLLLSQTERLLNGSVCLATPSLNLGRGKVHPLSTEMLQFIVPRTARPLMRSMMLNLSYRAKSNLWKLRVTLRGQHQGVKLPMLKKTSSSSPVEALSCLIGLLENIKVLIDPHTYGRRPGKLFQRSAKKKK